MVNTFASLGEVRYYDPPVYCPQAKALLMPGNWVIFKNEEDTEFTRDENDDETIGLIMATSVGDGFNTSRLKVNLFSRVTKELTQDLRLRRFTNPLYKWIPQILRTPRCKWVDTTCVESIAWVFQTQHLDSNPHEGHQGMANLFLLHYNDLGELLSTAGCFPFCSYYSMYSLILADCHQERVWNGLQILRAEICRHLGRYSEKQGSFTRISSQVVLCREAWQFLLSKVERATGPPIGRNACNSKRVLQPGLVLKSTRNVFYSTMIRFETEGQLKCLSSVLGELITMEVRKRRPKYGYVESLHENDVINIVAGSEEPEIPFRHRTDKQGIDFIYDGQNRVRIRMRYERFQYKLPLLTPSVILTRGIQRKSPLGADESADSSDEEDGDDSIHPTLVEGSVTKIGREFQFSARLYQVGTINLRCSTVAAKVVWPLAMNQQVHSFALDDVERWIAHRQREQLVI
jgi:hypothetical protein